MKNILDLIASNPAVGSLLKDESKCGNLNINEEALLLAAVYKQTKRKMLIVKNNQYTAQKLVEHLTPLVKTDVLLFSVEDSLRVEAIAMSPENKAKQLEIMNLMLEDKAEIVVTHAAGLIRYLPMPERFEEYSIDLKVNETLSMEELKEKLYYAGYEHVMRVDQPLTYASRGGIVDVFSMNQENPLRIEFFDNEIESIRLFDAATQRTIETLDHVKIIPATDLLLSEEDVAEIIAKGNEKLTHAVNSASSEIKPLLEENIQSDFDKLANHEKDAYLYRYMALRSKQATIGDYFKEARIYLSNIDEVKDKIRHMSEETIAYVQECVSIGKALPLFSLFAALDKACADHKVIEFQSFLDLHTNLTSGIHTLTIAEMSFEKKIEQMIELSRNSRIVVCVNGSEMEMVKNALNSRQTSYHEISEEDVIADGISLMKGSLAQGFEMTQEHVIVYTSRELFNQRKVLSKYTNKFNKAETLSSYQELAKGDYVVHQQYGVGMYNGIVTRMVNGLHKDFLQIIFKDDGQLFVPLEQFKLVRKFISKEGAAPKLNKLGTNDWEKTKKRISENVAELAQRLVALYSLREENIGYAFSKDTPDQIKFEEDFDYPLTPDQERAVREIKQDMESNKPMDRLLCGDVGFGKTEVAVRAAFKAVMDNKQVAFLCPTTILSQQHTKVFNQRFRNYAVRIEVLNRFVPAAQQKVILRDLKEGKVDILIGTHRILSNDVVFKDLGLLVIDEEQRFGVQHKEKIKELKTSIDVLSLSATPIPRTLQMSLIGIRSLSQLETPPLNRQSVQTYVLEKNDRMIEEIIQRELSRDGQVFYVYNNVKNIYAVATKLRTHLDIEVGVVHGQMDKDDIEDVMMRFIRNEFSVLVCTTIIETGIDIPNANTIIIDDADHFGLSQLYQIKGRVGRSSRLAYAYLFYQPQKQLSEVAAKRLKSIKEFAQLGSGYKIAMRDLTIRGAGDMLGPQQAGFIDTVGIDMYLEMLNDAIKKEKGIQTEAPKQMIKTNVSVDAYIPASFSEEDYEKITFYQSIDRVSTKEELLALMDETQDNYGRLPKSVQLLFEKKRLDILVNEPSVESFKEYEKEAELYFTPQYSDSLDGVKLFEIMTSLSRDIIMRYTNGKIRIRIPKNKDWLKKIIEVIERSQEAQR